MQLIKKILFGFMKCFGGCQCRLGSSLKNRSVVSSSFKVAFYVYEKIHEVVKGDSQFMKFK